MSEVVEIDPSVEQQRNAPRLWETLDGRSHRMMTLACREKDRPESEVQRVGSASNCIPEGSAFRGGRGAR